MTSQDQKATEGGARGGLAAGRSHASPSHRNRRRWVRRAIYAAGAALIVVGIVIAARPKPFLVESARVAKGPLSVTIEEPGRTRVRDRFVVSAPLAGEMSRVELRAGDTVTRTTILARMIPASAPLLDPRSRAEASARVATAEAAVAQARSAVARAEVALAHAEADLARDKRLAESGTLSPEATGHMELEVRLRREELASARFGVQRAGHEAEMARATLSRHEDGKRGGEAFEIPSPIEGRVLRVISPNAGFVQPGTPLVELGDPGALEVVVDVLTPDAVRIPPSARVTLERWGGLAPLDAHVRLVEPSAVTKLSALGVEEQRVTVVVDLDAPREKWVALGDGFRVETRVVVWEQPSVLTVPASATFRRGDAWSVFVVDGDRAKLRAVQIGQRSMRDLEITAGLAEGETVVVHPSDQLADGSSVKLRR